MLNLGPFGLCTATNGFVGTHSDLQFPLFNPNFADMYIKKEHRKDSKGQSYPYYRLWESYRDELGLTQKRPVLGLGRMEDFDICEQADFLLLLEKKLHGSQNIFPGMYSPKVTAKADEICAQLIALRKVDAIGGAKAENGLSEYQKKQEQRFIVTASSILHTDVREIGAEHLCLETARRLKIDKSLKHLGFTDSQISLALTQIVSRAVHPASELATVEWIKKSSDISRLTGIDADTLTKDHLYASAHRLYRIKDELKDHLSRWTKELFGYEDSIILYDLSNTYFEGKMDGSEVCQYGRSKEKRNDCKQIVLALVVNQLGFPKHYQLFEGNMSDSKSFPLIIDTLDSHIKDLGVAPTIVMDAGIATKENLQLLRERRYKFLCVSRSSSKVYQPKENSKKIKLEDKLGQSIELQPVSVDGNIEADEYFRVRSEAKAAKENAMNGQFCTRFEAMLEGIRASLSKKHGTKKASKVNERIGRAKAKYPSISYHYEITLTEDVEKKNITHIEWKMKDGYKAKDTAGVYFLQTNLDGKDGQTIWTIYNILKEVESSFRCMKTDLDLRPVYHKTDDACLAHLHLGILAYWVVISIRHQLKGKGIHRNWKQIVEVMNTHKSVTTTMTNLQNETVNLQKCSEPSLEVEEIYKAACVEIRPYKLIKSVGTHLKDATKYMNGNQEIKDG